MEWDLRARHLARNRKTVPAARRLVVFALAILLGAAWGPDGFRAGPAEASGPSSENLWEDIDSQAAERAETAARKTAAKQKAAGPAASITGRAGHIAFETFGREDSITHAELMPYLEIDQHTLFSDARLFMSNDGYFGGNVGFGYRYRLPEKNRFLGASLWYDLDDTTGEMFHQLGVSLESCGSLWDVRANAYLPIGDYEKDYSIAVRNQQFLGNQIVYTGLRRFGEAMTGYDLELSIPIPTEFGRSRNLSITPGSYMFFGNSAEDIYGYKVRAEGNVTSNLAMQVEMTSDDTFGTTVSLGVEFVLPGGSRLEDPDNICSRIRTNQFVHRNYNIIVSREVDLQPGRTAINPATGQPYVVQHVSSTSGGAGLGTAENPYHTIAQAQAAGGDIIFVHADSVLSDPVVMHAGEQILGEGISYYIDYDGFGVDLLPTVNDSTARPTLLGASGAAVTLASDSVLAGFVIDSPTGYGILGSSVDNVFLRNIDLVNSGSAGIYLQNVGGENTFRHLAITGAGGAGLAIDGGAGEFDFLDTTVQNATGAGVDVRNNSGSFAFDELDVIANAGGAGVSVVDSSADGTFDALDIKSNGSTGLYLRNTGELEIASGQIDSVAGTAVDIENATVDANLTSVSSSSAAVGIRIVDHEGQFLVVGGTDDGSGGLIQNATTGILLVNAGTVGFRHMDIDGSSVAVDASNTERLAFSFARITDSTSYGLDLLNTEIVEIVGSTFENNGGGLANTIRFRSDTQGDYGLYVSGSTITDASAAALAIATTGSGADSTLTLQIGGSEITTSRLGASAVQLNWNGAIAASILSNEFEGTGGSNIGVDVTTTATSDLVQFALVGNSFAFDGGNDVGMSFTTAGPSTISIGSNTVNFDGAGGTGMLFNLAESSNVYIYKNTVTDNVSGGTGILFSSIAGPSSVTLQSNTINLLSDTAIIDRGIIFTSITDTIEFLSPLNNTVVGATTPFFAPAGAVEGHAYVNNVTVP